MDFYREIYSMELYQVDQLIHDKISHYENNPPTEYDVVGYEVSENETKYNIDISDYNKSQIELGVNCFIPGYITKDKKIVYSVTCGQDGTVSNGGCYYYIDDDEYIYDFCHYIHDAEIVDEYELFSYILDFLQQYFKTLPTIERDTMFRVLVGKDGQSFKPIKEHSISDFKGKGNALCSEYAVLANNILNIFGIESYVVIGNIKNENEKKSDLHAYNFVSFTKGNDEVNLLLDFADYVPVRDIDDQIIDVSPFIGELDRLDNELIHSIVYDDEKLLFENYSYYVIGDTLLKVANGINREYSITSYISSDSNIKKCKVK